MLRDTFVIRCSSQHTVAVTPDLLDELAALVGADNLSFTRR